MNAKRYIERALRYDNKLSEPDDIPSKYYDCIAKGYDKLYGDEQRDKMKIILRLIALNPDNKVLDIGCGTGISSDLDCYCLGIDPSKKMIEIANNNNINPDHEFKVLKAEDINSLDIKYRYFDYALCVSVIHHIRDHDVFFSEIRRISKNMVLTIRKNSILKEKIINTASKYFKLMEQSDDSVDTIYLLR